MNSSEATSQLSKISTLIDAWCEERKLRPLAILLPPWLGHNGLTDGWMNLRGALRHVLAMCRDDLKPAELEIIGKAIAEIDAAIER